MLPRKAAALESPARRLHHRRRRRHPGRSGRLGDRAGGARGRTALRARLDLQRSRRRRVRHGCHQAARRGISRNGGPTISSILRLRSRSRRPLPMRCCATSNAVRGRRRDLPDPRQRASRRRRTFAGGASVAAAGASPPCRGIGAASADRPFDPGHSVGTQPVARHRHRRRLQPGRLAVEGQCGGARRTDGRPRHPLRHRHRRNPRRRLSPGRRRRRRASASPSASRSGFVVRRRPATWLDHATRAGADAIGLKKKTGEIAPGKAADFLLVDIDTPEFTPSWDLAWELVRLGNRDQIEAVFVAGRAAAVARLAAGLGRPRPDAQDRRACPRDGCPRADHTRPPDLDGASQAPLTANPRWRLSSCRARFTMGA